MSRTRKPPVETNETKLCAYCGKEFKRIPGVDTNYKWQRRKFCDRTCWGKRQRPSTSRTPPLLQPSPLDAGVRHLMRDGKWLVPPEQRPQVRHG